jgi:hypothetical protein
MTKSNFTEFLSVCGLSKCRKLPPQTGHHMVIGMGYPDTYNWTHMSASKREIHFPVYRNCLRWLLTWVIYFSQE